MRAVEDYDGDSGYYADSGDSEGYTDGGSENYNEGEGEAAANTEGGDNESEYYGGKNMFGSMKYKIAKCGCCFQT